MIAGPSLDAEIARKIFRFVVIIDSEDGRPLIRDNSTRKLVSVPPYSTDTTTAHIVVKKFKDAGCSFNIGSEIDAGDLSWKVTIHHPGMAGLNVEANGVTLPLAICNAVLQFNQLFQLK